MIYKYPENLLTWKPVFNWLTRLDARAEMHGWDLWLDTTRAELAAHVDQQEAWLHWAANTLGAAMVPSSDAEARICNDILLHLESEGWIHATKWAPRRGGAPRPRKGYSMTLFARPVDCVWEPGDRCEEMQRFVREVVR